MRLALFEPDIPQNTGTLLRLAACFNLPVDIIEPCGFVFNDQKMRRAGMDYFGYRRLYPSRFVGKVLRATHGADCPADDQRVGTVSQIHVQGRRYFVVGTRKRGRPRLCASRRRRASAYSDAPRSAVDQRRHIGRDRAGRGFASNACL